MSSVHSEFGHHRTIAPDRRWTAHPRLALAVRAISVLAPVAVSVAVGFTVHRFLPVAQQFRRCCRYLGNAAGLAAVVGLILAERLARTLLPLATLLSLSLVFPSQVPKRFWPLPSRLWSPCSAAAARRRRENRTRTSESRMCPAHSTPRRSQSTRPADPRAFRAGFALLRGNDLLAEEIVVVERRSRSPPLGRSAP